MLSSRMPKINLWLYNIKYELMGQIGLFGKHTNVYPTIYSGTLSYVYAGKYSLIFQIGRDQEHE